MGELWDGQKGFSEGSAGLKAQEVSEEITSTTGPGGPGPPPQPVWDRAQPWKPWLAPQAQGSPGPFSAVTYYITGFSGKPAPRASRFNSSSSKGAWTPGCKACSQF